MMESSNMRRKSAKARSSIRSVNLLLALLVVFSLSATAATLRVPEEYSVIQEAIDAASPNDTVYVGAGWYVESLQIEKAICLVGSNRTQVLIRSPDPEDDVVLIRLLDKGDVTIQGVEVTGGDCGFCIEVGLGAQVTVRDVVAYENRCGLERSGNGVFTLEQNYFCDHNEIGVHLDGGVSSVRDNEIVSCHTGILLTGEGIVELSRNIVGLCERAIVAASDACEYSTEMGSFAGTVVGQQNLLSSTDTLICPNSPSKPWPYHFLVPAYAEEIKEARRRTNTGLYWLKQDDFHRAEKGFLACLTILEGVSLPVFEADCCYYLSMLYQNQSLFQKANEFWERARTIYADRGMKVEESSVVRQIAWMYLEIGKYEKSLTLFDHARLTYSTFERPIWTAQCDEGMGWSYLRLGSFDRAMEVFERAEAALSDQENWLSVANLNYSMASTYLALGFQKAALDALEEARSLYEQESRPRAVANTTVGIGNVYGARARYQEALACYEEARGTLTETVGESDAAAYPELSTGLVYFDLEHYTEALTCYKNGLAIIDQIKPTEGWKFSAPDLRWSFLFNLGLCYEKLELDDMAKSAYETSIAVIESIRGGLNAEELKLVWQEQTQHVYDRLIDLLYRMGEGSSAFTYAERCRARTFLDLLAMGPVGTIENVAEEGIRSGVVDTSVIKADLAEVVTRLPKDTAVLEYFVSEDTLYLWVVTKDGVSEPIPIKIGREVLIDRIVSFRKMLETPPTGGVVAPSLELLSAARDLFDLLIGPVEENVAGFSHLVIVPSGPLYYLPFSALYRCPGCAEERELYGGKFLMERFNLSYAPSLTTLKYAQAIGAQTYPEPTFLGLADPDSGDPTIHRLPDAQKEAESIAALFSPQSEVYVDRQATEEVVQSCSATAREILFSTHGHFNPLNPMFSYLLLAPTEENDGELYAHEIFSLPLRANMVVLSACETLLPSLTQMTDQLNKIARRAGDGTTQELTEDQLKALTAGDEVVGLTRAFISAGASSVLSSLWSVPSGSTAALMVAFYGHLNDGLNKAEALRQAQMDVKEVYPHPWYWAAFNLMGDWR